MKTIEIIKLSIEANKTYVKKYQANVKREKIAIAGYNKELSEAKPTQTSLIELMEITIAVCEKRLNTYKDCVKRKRAELKLNKERLAEIENQNTKIKNERVIQIHGHGFTEFFRNDDDFNHVNKFSQFGFEKLGLKNFKDLTDFCDKQETDTLGTIHGGTFPELYLTNGGAK